MAIFINKAFWSRAESIARKQYSDGNKTDQNLNDCVEDGIYNSLKELGKYNKSLMRDLLKDRVTIFDKIK